MYISVIISKQSQSSLSEWAKGTRVCVYFFHFHTLLFGIFFCCCFRFDIMYIMLYHHRISGRWHDKLIGFEELIMSNFLSWPELIMDSETIYSILMRLNGGNFSVFLFSLISFLCGLISCLSDIMIDGFYYYDSILFACNWIAKIWKFVESKFTEMLKISVWYGLKIYWGISFKCWFA